MKQTCIFAKPVFSLESSSITANEDLTGFQTSNTNHCPHYDKLYSKLQLNLGYVTILLHVYIGVQRQKYETNTVNQN